LWPVVQPVEYGGIECSLFVDDHGGSAGGDVLLDRRPR
jgi:hypothetical protein